MSKDKPASEVATHTDAMRHKLNTDGVLLLDVKVIPRAARSGVAEWLADGSLKVKVTAAPENGRANQEVCTLLAEYWGVPKRNIHITAGETSRQKRLKILL